ncbi:hypothetical protein FCV25MIE_16162, partial [Fagus crenata]
GLLGSEDGSESVGVISEYTAAESIEGNEKNMSMVLTEEVSESVMLEAVSGAWGEFLENTEVPDGVGDTEQKELVPLTVEPLAVTFPVDVENHGSTDDGSFCLADRGSTQQRKQSFEDYADDGCVDEVNDVVFFHCQNSLEKNYILASATVLSLKKGQLSMLALA